MVSRNEALQKARDLELDLVEIASNSKPPVCKIMNYGKFKYEQQKKKSSAKKKQKQVEIKEVKIRPNIEDNDYNVKLRNAQKFIAEGNKVKFSLRFRGREMAHQETAWELFKRIRVDMQDYAEVELEPKMEGRQIAMVLGKV